MSTNEQPVPATVSLDGYEYVRVIANGMDVTAKLTTEQAAQLVRFALKLVKSTPTP